MTLSAPTIVLDSPDSSESIRTAADAEFGSEWDVVKVTVMTPQYTPHHSLDYTLYYHLPHSHRRKLPASISSIFSQSTIKSCQSRIDLAGKDDFSRQICQLGLSVADGLIISVELYL